MRRLGRLLEQVRRLPPLAVDGAIGAWIFAVAVLFQLASTPFRPAALGLQALASVGVALRRRSLWVGCALVVLAHIGGLFVTSDFIPLAVMALLYTVAELRGLGPSLLALVVSCALPFVGWNYRWYHLGWPPFADVKTLVETIDAYLVMVWFAGRAQARRRDIAGQLERRVVQLREERARLSQAAIDAERSRIARDLHAVVVQGVKRMNAEARSARELLDIDSVQGSGSVGAIESTGRATLADMRRLLMVLRTRDGPTAPPPDVDDESELVGVPSAGGGTVNIARAAPTLLSPDGALPSRAQSLIAVPWVADTLLVAALAALAAAEPFIVPGSYSLLSFAPLASIALAVLLLRRRFPMTVLAVVLTDSFIYNSFFHGSAYTVDHTVFVAIFSVAAFRGLPWGIVAVGAQVIAYVPQVLFGGTYNGPPDLAFWATVYLFAVAGGVAVRNARRLNAELQDQTELLRRTREERIRLAVLEERIRLARDLHDVVAHGVTVMVVQAGAARALAGREPARAREALAAVERTGQEALGELDTFMGHLGFGSLDAADPLVEPANRTLHSLVDHAVEAGLRVDLLIEGDPDLLDAGLELTVYRILQEALTNIRRHAPGARAWVVVRLSSDAVDIEVTDTGQATGASSPSVPGAGHGLVGITERAALFGGTAEAGPTAEGGFRVRARLGRESVLV